MRKSPISGSQRLAVNPANAMLNYLYSVLGSESRLVLAAIGLDPDLGVSHADTPARDSLACDVMEAVRPEVDAYVLDWITRQVLKREWFFEQRDGSCRLVSTFTEKLGETAMTWGRTVAPVAERVTRAFWATSTKPARLSDLPTRLTQRQRHIAKGNPFNIPTAPHEHHKASVALVGCRSLLETAIARPARLMWPPSILMQSVTQAGLQDRSPRNPRSLSSAIEHSAEARARESRLAAYETG